MDRAWFAGPGDECHGESVVRIPTLTYRTHAYITIAAAGSIPLTLGVIMWIVGTSMGLASHHGWAGVARVGLILMLAGLLCGLALIVLAVVWRRGRPGPGPSGAGDPRPPGVGEEWNHAVGADPIPVSSPAPVPFQPPALAPDPAFPPDRAPPGPAAPPGPEIPPDPAFAAELPAGHDYPETPRDRPASAYPQLPGEGRHRKLLRRTERH
jgi:hypothetical protein